ncbi:MAG: HAD hydrolase-like protein [Acidiferrobacteraceae bacterium]
MAERISLCPHVEEFLQAMRDAGKRFVLATNAHGKAVTLKFRHSRIDQYMDAAICTHDLRLAKKHVRFCGQLQEIEPFDLTHTLLIDDSLPVLRCARDYGVKHPLVVRKSDLRGPGKDCPEFSAIESFRSLLSVG